MKKDLTRPLILLITGIICLIIGIYIISKGQAQKNSEIIQMGTSFLTVSLIFISLASLKILDMLPDILSQSKKKTSSSIATDNIPYIEEKDGSKRGVPIEPSMWPWEF